MLEVASINLIGAVSFAMHRAGSRKLKLFAKALTLAMQHNFVNRFTNKTSPKVLSTFKNVRETRVTSDSD